MARQKMLDFESAPNFERIEHRKHGRRWKPGVERMENLDERRVSPAQMDVAKSARARFYGYREIVGPMQEKRLEWLKDIFRTLQEISRFGKAIYNQVLLVRVREARMEARAAMDKIWEAESTENGQEWLAGHILELARQYGHRMTYQEAALFLVRKRQSYALYDLAQSVNKEIRKDICNGLERMGRKDIAQKLREGVSRDDLIAVMENGEAGGGRGGRSV